MIIDLTHTITPDMPMYPGSEAPSLTSTGSLTRAGYRETRLLIDPPGAGEESPAGEE